MIVVTDTSVVLNLCFLQQESLLLHLFKTVLAPPAVALEFERLSAIDPRFRGLRFPAFIHQVAPSVILPALQALEPLDAGEIAAISLAFELKADAILVDERAGRAAATNLGLKTTGLLGVLLQAKSSGYIPIIAPFLDRLEEGARFWLSPVLKKQVLRQANEL